MSFGQNGSITFHMKLVQDVPTLIPYETNLIHYLIYVANHIAV